MGDSRTRFRGKRGCLCAAAACAAAIGFSGPSAAQAGSQKPDSGARGAAGTIVQYEEAPGANVVYLEEKGGMVSAIALPVPAAREAPAASSPARKAAAKRSAAKPPEGATRAAPNRAGPRP